MRAYQNPWKTTADQPRVPVIAGTRDRVVDSLTFNQLFDPRSPANVERVSMFDPKNTGNWSIEPGGEKVFASVGDHFEFNASSNQEVIQIIGKLMNMGRAGGIQRTKFAGYSSERISEMTQMRTSALEEALADSSGEKFQALGEVVGEEVWLTMKRDGFARRLLMLKDVGRGVEGKLRVKRKDDVAYLIAEGNIPVNRIQVPYIYPPEYKIACSVKIDTGEIARTDADILEEKYQDALEAIMVREDLKWKALADTAATAVNDLVYFETFTPTAFQALKSQITGWGLPVMYCVLAYDLWDDIISAADFSGWFDPVHKHELILEGQLGSILDVQIITDAIREPKLKVIDPGTCYFTAAPQNLGGICQRKALEMHATNHFAQAEGARGWYGELIEGMALVSARAITKGIKSS